MDHQVVYQNAAAEHTYDDLKRVDISTISGQQDRSTMADKGTPSIWTCPMIIIVIAECLIGLLVVACLGVIIYNGSATQNDAYDGK